MQASQTDQEIAARGKKIYSERLRSRLEPAYNGQYVVINVENGEYEIDSDHLAASDRAAVKFPGAPLYSLRVGMGNLGRVGGRSATLSTQ